ncbi:MAG: type I restriction-modification enzyme R subunit C-terminal domain-containing protein [Bacteroidia bacterium]
MMIIADVSEHCLNQDLQDLRIFRIRPWLVSPPITIRLVRTPTEDEEAIIAELQEQGVMVEELYEAVDKQVDLFDLICHVAYGQPPLTRKERANNVKKCNYFTKYGEQARKVLEALLDKYADEGITNIEKIEVLRVNPFDEMGSPTEIISQFGNKEKYLQAVRELEIELYKSV